MKIRIHGIGIWTRGACNWEEFCTLVAAQDSGAEAQWQAPKPEAIPARERRRAPLMIKLAIEVAGQACARTVAEQPGFDLQQVATVFASAMGDTDITDYLCKILAGESKVLSPTKFHNSVHNAPAGYWSISTQNRESSSSVAASQESFPVALLEAAVQATAEARPVLLVVSDVVVPAPLGEVYPIGEPFGAALVIKAVADDADAWDVVIRATTPDTAWPDVRHPLLQTISDTNPAARCLALLEAIAVGWHGSLAWPLNDSTCLQMSNASD